MFLKLIASIIFCKSSMQEAFPRCKILQNVCKRRSLVVDLTKISDFLVFRGKNRGRIQIFFRVFQKLGLFSGLRNP